MRDVPASGTWVAILTRWMLVWTDINPSFREGGPVTTQTPSIGEQSQAFLAGPATAMPAEAMNAFAAEQAELDEAGVPTGISAPGAPMPDGELLDVRGDATSLAQVRAGRPAVVVFYRGAHV